MTIRVMAVVGARPNLMKIAPLMGEIHHNPDMEPYLVHTGQHYDPNLSDVFFKELGIPAPDVHLNVGSGSHAEQTGRVMLAIEPVILDLEPDIVVVVGDVNSTLAAALASAKLHIPVAHVEAGLRSFDMKMPEEVNRVLTDHISDILFATEPAAVTNLAREGIESKNVYLVGNVMIDALMQILPLIHENNSVKKMGLAGERYGLLTLHRPSNVDSEDSLLKVRAVLREAASSCNIVFPAHPRTLKSIETFGLENEFNSLKNLRITEPLGYVDFMNLVFNSSFVMTDSGGIQSETTWLGIPCITLREKTEHIITLEEGTNRLTGLDVSKVVTALDWAKNFDKSNYSPPKLWDAKAAEKIVNIIFKHLSIN